MGKREVHRITVTEDEIVGTIESLQELGFTSTLSSGAISMVAKLRMLAFKINLGIATPAYVTTGVKKQSSISLDSLGASESEKESVFQEGKYNNPAEMDDAVNDQLTWMINHPEVESKDMPDVKEFMRGGKYYAQIDSSAVCSSNDNSNSSSNSNDSIGSDSNELDSQLATLLSM